MTCSPKELGKLSAIAKKEIGEADVTLDDSVKRLRELIAEKYGDILPPDANNLLERSLRCRKFNLDQAATQVHLFFKLLSDMYGMQKEMLFVPSIHQSYYFESLGLGVLKQRDSKGRILVLANYERLPAETYKMDAAMSANLMLMDELTRSSVDTQRIGVVYLCHFKGFEFGHAKEYTLSRIRTAVKFAQGSFPVRLKVFHVLGSPPLFKYTYALIKPFLREKLRSRIYFHGKDLTEFHSHVSPDILPDFLGGKLSYEESMDLDLTRRLATKDGYYKELFKYGYTANSNSAS